MSDQPTTTAASERASNRSSRASAERPSAAVHAPDYRPLAGNDNLTCAVCYESWPCSSARSRSSRAPVEKAPPHDAGVCECNAVAWDLALDETRTIRRYRVWQCRFCKRLREREDPGMTDSAATKRCGHTHSCACGMNLPLRHQARTTPARGFCARPCAYCDSLDASEAEPR